MNKLVVVEPLQPIQLPAVEHSIRLQMASLPKPAARYWLRQTFSYPGRRIRRLLLAAAGLLPLWAAAKRLQNAPILETVEEQPQAAVGG